MEGYITMSKQELNRIELIQKVIEKRLKQHQAAQQLNLTVRQVKRLCKAYKQTGPQGLVSKHRGMPSNRRMDPLSTAMLNDPLR
jgi:transcriptional regulator GlxA family with amidase domain